MLISELLWVMTVDKMDSSKIANWVQVTATVGVLIGIVLVVIEMRQAKALAHAEVTAQFFQEVAQNNRAQMGENPAAAGEPEPGQSNIEVERFDPISTGGGADISAGGEPLAGMPAVPEAENHTVNTGDISLGPIAEPLLSNRQVEDPLVATDDTEQASLSAGEEKVYDLSDFDAIAVDSANAAAAAEDDRIYDLEEFGAVAIS